MEDEVFNSGDRVMVYDPRLFVDDVSTPVSFCTRTATVARWYGRLQTHYAISDLTLGPYPSLIDVVFDYDGFESHGHFTSHVKFIKKENGND